jgi:hypothetical protein
MLGAIKAELAKPRLFEIGLRDKVELGTTVSRKPEDERRVTYRGAGGDGGAGPGWAGRLHALRAGHVGGRLWLFRNKPAEAHFDTASKVVSGLEAAAFGFAVGSGDRALARQQHRLWRCVPARHDDRGFFLGLSVSGIRALSASKTGDGPSALSRWLRFVLRAALFAWLAWTWWRCGKQPRLKIYASLSLP